jgi:hypothetical protein
MLIVCVQIGCIGNDRLCQIIVFASLKESMLLKLYTKRSQFCLGSTHGKP